MGLLFLLTMSQSRAQVTIKERVDIGGPSHPNVTGHKVLTDGEAIWVAPASGWWKLRVTAAWQTLVPISSSAYFQVITPQGTFTGNITEWASQPNNLWFSFWDYCTGRDTSGWLYAIGGVIPYDRTLAIHVVSAGDTLRFRYYADFGVSEFSQVYQDPHPEWVIKMWLEHPCIVNFDICQLHLSYFYDTTFTRFAVETLKDTIAHGDTLDFHVVAMSELNQETPLAGDTPLTLRISPSRYGRFIDQTGDTVPSPLSNVPYQDAREGRIRFVANGTIPDSLQPVAIEAVQMSDTTKRGADTIYIRPARDTLRVTVDTTQIQPRRTGGTDTATVTVRATRGGSPLSGVPVHLESRGIDSSGGHAHTVGRPAGVFGDSDGITDSSGIYRTTFYSNWFGGKEWIVASSPQIPHRDSMLMTIRVPGLALLAAGAKYNKVGGTCTHHGPGGVSGCNTPDNNHWGTSKLMQAIPAIADAYSVLHSGVRLRINDMSLPYGGIFDIDTTRLWLTPHNQHREGLNADIGYSGLDSLNQSVPIDTTDIQKIIYQKTEIPPLHHRPPGPPAPHFHMYVKKD